MPRSCSVFARTLHQLRSVRFADGDSLHSPGARTVGGVGQVRKWASVWSLASAAQGGNAEVLPVAIIRARRCEILGESSASVQRDSGLFLLGMCSLLDAMLRARRFRRGGDIGRRPRPAGWHARRGLRRCAAVRARVVAGRSGGVATRFRRGWNPSPHRGGLSPIFPSRAIRVGASRSTASACSRRPKPPTTNARNHEARDVRPCCPHSDRESSMASVHGRHR